MCTTPITRTLSLHLQELRTFRGRLFAIVTNAPAAWLEQKNLTPPFYCSFPVKHSHGVPVFSK